jgi:hypothetical protein
MKESIWECMRLESDENVSPLMRPATPIGEKIYASLRLFIANKMDRFTLQSVLLEHGVSEQAVFSSNFQALLQRHHENAAVLFAHLRRALMQQLSPSITPVTVVNVITEIPLPTTTCHDAATMTARSQREKQLPATNATPLVTPRAPHYDPLPLKTGWNPMFDAKVKQLNKAHELAAKRLGKFLTDRPVAAAMLAVVPKSFVDKTLKEGEILKRRNSRQL